jgi:uncharacterized membrane protein
LTILAFLALAAASVALRLWQLDRRSLWVDEIFQAECVDLPLGALLDCVRSYVDQTPLAYVITHMLYLLASKPPAPLPAWFVRLPEVIAGVATVLVASLLGRELLGRRGGWMTGLIWAIAPLAIAYSQEARMYAWLTLVSTISGLLLIYALRHSSLKAWLGFGIATALNFYSHYLSLFVLVAEGIFVLFWLGGKIMRYFRESSGQTQQTVLYDAWMIVKGGILSLGVACLMTAPWLSTFFNYLELLRVKGVNASWQGGVPLTPTYLRDLMGWLLLNIPDKNVFTLSQFTDLNAITIVLTVLSLLGVLWMARQARMSLLFCACWIIVPTIYFALTRGMPVTLRYLLFFQVGYYLLLAAGVIAVGEVMASIVSRLVRATRIQEAVTWVGVALLLVLVVPAQELYYSAPYDDWRGAAAYLEKFAKPGDVIITLGDVGRSVVAATSLSYYLRSSSSLLIVNSSGLNSQVIDNLRGHKSDVWGVLLNGGLQDHDRMEFLGGKDFTSVELSNVSVLTPKWRMPLPNTIENTVGLIVRFSGMNPEGAATAIQLLYSQEDQRVNLLLNGNFADAQYGTPSNWKVTGTANRLVKEEGYPVFEISSSEVSDSINATQRVHLQPEHIYLLRFECRNSLADGTQRVYVTFPGVQGGPIAFPHGAGYICPTNQGWHLSSIGFQVPSAQLATSDATIWLRNAGVGNAYFRNLSLIEVAAGP